MLTDNVIIISATTATPLPPNPKKEGKGSICSKNLDQTVTCIMWEEFYYGMFLIIFGWTILYVLYVCVCVYIYIYRLTQCNYFVLLWYRVTKD